MSKGDRVTTRANVRFLREEVFFLWFFPKSQARGTSRTTIPCQQVRRLRIPSDGTGSPNVPYRN